MTYNVSLRKLFRYRQQTIFEENIAASFMHFSLRSSKQQVIKTNLVNIVILQLLKRRSYPLTSQEHQCWNVVDKECETMQH